MISFYFIHLQILQPFIIILLSLKLQYMAMGTVGILRTLHIDLPRTSPGVGKGMPSQFGAVRFVLYIIIFTHLNYINLSLIDNTCNTRQWKIFLTFLHNSIFSSSGSESRSLACLSHCTPISI